MLKKISLFLGDNHDSQKNQRTQNNVRAKAAHDSFDFIQLIREWRNIAGDKLSEHTIPLKNQNGTLIILSNHSAFANELSFMEQPLKKKIFATFPNLEAHVKKIQFIVDSTHFTRQYEQFIRPTENLKKANARKLHPMSPEFRRLKAEAEELFRSMEDPELREKFTSLYIQAKHS